MWLFTMEPNSPPLDASWAIFILVCDFDLIGKSLSHLLLITLSSTSQILDVLESSIYLLKCRFLDPNPIVYVYQV